MSRVSVIVPVYNREKFLAQCVDSILGQTHRDIELILVDDGSDDSSAQICDDYKQKDSRVKVLHLPKCGVSIARNKGLEMATGEYIAFVDSDDFIDERMYERLLEVINNCDVDMAICDIYQVDENQIESDRKCGIQDEVVVPRKLLARLSDKGGWVYISACNRLHKRNVLNNIHFPDGKIREDEWEALSIYTACKRIALTGDAFYYYRVNSNSIMGKKSNIAHLDGVEAVYNRFLKLQEYGWMDLLPSAFLCGRNMFEDLRYIKISTKEDKESRKNAIDMYRYMMKHAGCKISLKNRLVGWFPVLYFKVKNFLH